MNGGSTSLVGGRVGLARLVRLFGIVIAVSAVAVIPACTSEADATDGESVPNPNGKKAGSTCKGNEDCQSLSCQAGKCTAVTGGNPTDKVKNGTESDVDCGGEAAPKCADGKTCKSGGDCESGSCISSTCKAPAPDDKVKNGDETDIDCGGTKAPKCALDLGCATDADCSSAACSYAKKCVEFKSCTAHFGGDTCGPDETAPGATQESCCATVQNGAGKRVGRYHVTAGRMRAFIERFNGNVLQWAQSNPPGWNPAWNGDIPASMDDANFMLGPDMKRGCNISVQSKGARTYWQAVPGDTSDFSKDVLDEKALNCVPWHLAQALCVYDGGRLTTQAENVAIMTNDGANTYPWQFQDKSPYSESQQDERLDHQYSYATPNPPAGMRMDGASPLDRSFFIAPPGRRPMGANKIGVHDAVGNMLTWAGDAVRGFTWTMSWEEHPKKTTSQVWPTGNEQNGYYAIGARCIFD